MLKRTSVLSASGMRFAAGPGISQSFIIGFVVLLDCLVLAIVGLLIYKSYITWFDAKWGLTDYSIYQLLIAINTLATVVLLYFCDLYKINAITHPNRKLRRIWVLCMSLFVVWLVVGFGFKISADISRGWAFIWCFANPVAICIHRILFSRLVGGSRVKEKLIKNIAIYGRDNRGLRLAKLVGENSEGTYVRIVGIYDERGTRLENESEALVNFGNLDDLIWATRQNAVDEIIVALPWAAETRVLEVLSKLETLPVPIWLSPDLVGLNFLHHTFSQRNGVPVLNVSEKPLSDWDNALKTCFDVVLACILLIIFLPLILFISLSIKVTSPGTVFFIQKRMGYNNNPIGVIKFRTLFTHHQDEHGKKLVTRGDPRVTLVGKFLRRSSLDELPQLFNVLKGEMSIVGPRPHPLEAKAAGALYEKIVLEYPIRHKVKPGITGWAQINGWRGETDTSDKILRRVEHDLFYINHWSMLSDIKIVLKTVPVVLFGKSAF